MAYTHVVILVEIKEHGSNNIIIQKNESCSWTLNRGHITLYHQK